MERDNEAMWVCEENIANQFFTGIIKTLRELKKDVPDIYFEIIKNKFEQEFGIEITK